MDELRVVARRLVAFAYTDLIMGSAFFNVAISCELAYVMWRVGFMPGSHPGELGALVVCLAIIPLTVFLFIKAICLPRQLWKDPRQACEPKANRWCDRD